MKNLRGQTRDIYYGIKRRCYDKTFKYYPVYGGRGIRVCKRWLSSFDNFVADMGYRPEGKTLDRIDPNKGYAPDNCRWATPVEQARNLRCCIRVTYNGEDMVLSEAIERSRTELCSATLRWRIQQMGLSFEQAISIPKTTELFKPLAV